MVSLPCFKLIPHPLTLLEAQAMEESMEEGEILKMYDQVREWIEGAAGRGESGAGGTARREKRSRLG